MTQRHILLTGANGRTGRAILKAMVAQGLCVRAFIRNENQAAPLKQLGAADIAVGDFEDAASIEGAVRGMDKLLHIGPPMHPDEVAISQRFIDAGKQHGLKHFIYYSVMHPLRRDVRHHKLKLDVEEAVIESGLPYTIVQPARYMQHLVPLWQRVVKDGVHAMPFSTSKPFNIVDLRDLADVCAIVAAEGTHAYATYELAGPQALSQNDMAAIIQDVIGRPVKAERVSWEEMTQKAKAAGASEDRIAQMLIMNKHYDAHGFLGNPNILEYLLGRPATRFQRYVAHLAKELGT